MGYGESSQSFDIQANECHKEIHLRIKIKICVSGVENKACCNIFKIQKLWKKLKCHYSLTSLLVFCTFFSFSAQKLLKMNILISVWCAQQPNAGQNI